MKQTINRMFLHAVIALALITATTGTTAQAEESITLRVHHFMTEKAPLHIDMLVPLAKRIEKASNGRLKLALFASMSLGGRPGDLYDQAIDGAVDIALTLPGYTAGRFNRTEVFELPFIMENNIATSKAFWDFVQSDLQASEYEETRILAAWVHGPGVLHSKQPIQKLEDLAGKEMRGPTRVVTDMLGELGAIPLGMPLPKIPSSLSKGVIVGAFLPWSVTPSIRLAELVDYHTEFSGARSPYTATFVLAMNHDSYAALPDDLRALLDAETGKALSASSATAMHNADAFGREKAGTNSIIVLDKTEVTRWEKAAHPVYTRWLEHANEKGFDGKATIAQAKSLIVANQ